MLARAVSVSHITPTRRPTPRFQALPKIKRVKMSKGARATLAIILRPSATLWKPLSRRLRSTWPTNTNTNTTSTSTSTSTSTPSSSTDTLVGSTSVETVTLSDGTSSTEYTGPKKVRFDDQPLIFSPKLLAKRPRRASCRSPERPCLVVRRYSDPYTKSPEATTGADVASIYEDCLFDYLGFKADLQALEDREYLDERRIEDSRTSAFYETEFGVTKFDRVGYAQDCLSKWIDKQREAERAPKKLVLEDPAHLPWPSRALPSVSFERPDWARPRPPKPTPVLPSPRSLIERVQTRIVDEFENAVVVLSIGLLIYTCLFLYFLYDVFTRGFGRPDS
ncbi:hypothetical protein HYDPIDRAFT_28813 [Hydnomerulius pinastri MD-312]|uniref:Uncharacterized protein n=1 Tax=Hydnomerulius pinastri MD-312 TaxID=994086 RepID=A0A0C9W0R0_9AGAM|nr:hypothetical protein HYDPIDRAFT_28813 [Hydnomerulius pinastri MD-312]